MATAQWGNVNSYVVEDHPSVIFTPWIKQIDKEIHRCLYRKGRSTGNNPVRIQIWGSLDGIESEDTPAEEYIVLTTPTPGYTAIEFPIFGYIYFRIGTISPPNPVRGSTGFVDLVGDGGIT
jgi:hypothetical protein